MAEPENRSAVLMSIKPCWAEAIMDGRKLVEFRRVRFGRSISHVIVYATSPVQRVVGYFEVADITEARPQVLWQMFADVGEIGHDAFQRYYQGVSDGVAIHVGRVVRLPEQLELQAVCPEAVPPQSYRYANATVIRGLERRARGRSVCARSESALA